MWRREAERQGRAFLQHVVPAVLRPARTLWNEVIGFFFLCFGVIFGFRTAHYALQHDALRMVVAGSCTLLMAWYGIGSFRRARKIARS